MKPEFSRPTEIRPFLEQGDEKEIAADPAERKVLALRFGIPSLEAFSIMVHGEKAGAGMYQLKGRIVAKLTRTCVRTLEPMLEAIDQPFEVRLVERAIFETMGEGREEEPIDIEVLEDETLDLGELAAQYLSLLMDPFPRSNEAKVLPPLDVSGERQGGAFAALGKLKEKP